MFRAIDATFYDFVAYVAIRKYADFAARKIQAEVQTGIRAQNAPLKRIIRAVEREWSEIEAVYLNTKREIRSKPLRNRSKVINLKVFDCSNSINHQ